MPTKYRSKATIVDGICFASKKEARRYGELNLLRRLGEIRNLETQFKMPVWVMNFKGTRSTLAFNYVADFKYNDGKSGDLVIEDVKGFRTPLYRLKKKCVEAQYEISIREI